LIDTSDMAKRLLDGVAPDTYAGMFTDLNHLNGSLGNQLQKEAVFRVPAELKDYYGRDDLFGPEVAHAFSSCARDIREAGNCYALEQEDACVHHLMMVLERGLKALAKTVGVSPFHHTGWQSVLNKIESQLKSLPGGAQLDFYREVHSQFGFLKVAYRNHSEHAHDDPYDPEFYESFSGRSDAKLHGFDLTRCAIKSQPQREEARLWGGRGRRGPNQLRRAPERAIQTVWYSYLSEEPGMNANLSIAERREKSRVRS
jgi:hypothetical protein